MKTLQSSKTSVRKPEDDSPASDILNYEDVLRVVESWSSAQRTALARIILNMPAAQVELAERRRDALAKLRGFLKTEECPPSDELVEQWLEERRMEKYG